MEASILIVKFNYIWLKKYLCCIYCSLYIDLHASLTRKEAVNIDTHAAPNNGDKNSCNLL